MDLAKLAAAARMCGCRLIGRGVTLWVEGPKGRAPLRLTATPADVERICALVRWSG